MSYADRLTEAERQKIERKVTELYRESAADLRSKVADYWDSSGSRLEAMRKMLAAGEITEAHYRQWVFNNVGRGKRWEALRDEIARRAANTNQVAAAYINDKTPGIYSLHANYTAYQIEQAGKGVSFTLINEQAVRNLVEGNNQSEFKISDGMGGYTYRRLHPEFPADYAWNSDQIERQLTLGILAGEGVKGMTERFLSVMGSNRKAAIRNARTAITSAQNAGTLATMSRARDMGIRIKKQWLADDDITRTRDSHQRVNGEQVEIDETFSNGLAYPGDPSGEPAEVYNCRCTMVFVLPDVSDMPIPEQEEENEKSLFDFDVNELLEMANSPQQEQQTEQPPIEWVDSLHPEKIAGVKRTAESMTFEEADNYSTNPRYEKGAGNKTNCQTCVVANEARRRGYDVIAGPNRRGNAAYAASMRTELAWIDPDTGEHPQKMYNKDVRTSADAYDWLDSVVKPGERYTIDFEWAYSGGGHIINMDKTEDGVLRLHDNQPDKSYDAASVPQRWHTEQVGRQQIEAYLNSTKIHGNVQRYREIEIDEKGKQIYTGDTMEVYTGICILRVDDKEFYPRFADHALKKP